MNGFTRFTCQDDSGCAAFKGRDDNSFPCFVLFAEIKTLKGLAGEERERVEKSVS